MDKNKTQIARKIPDVNSLSVALSPSFAREKDYFIENIAILLTSGLDLLSVLQAMSAEFKSAGMKAVSKYILESVEEGTPLWMALSDLKLVPDYVISLVKIGEESGRLPENFKVIVSQNKKEKNLKSKIQSAMAYPLLVLALSVIILLGITWFILPSLSSVYSRLGIQLPTLTVYLINIGTFMSKYGAIVAPTVVFVIFGTVYVLFFNPSTKHIGQTILFRSPLIGNYVREIELSRFGFYLGSLMSAGVPISDALSSLIGVGSFYPYFNLYRFIHEKILEGYTFQKIFSEYKNITRYIPAVTQNMINNGEKSGKLPDVLVTIGEIYESRTDNATKNLASILEPALLIVVWIGVAGIALGIVLPIYSLIGNISDFSSGSTNTNNNSTVETPAPTITATITAPVTPTDVSKFTPTPIITITDTPSPTPTPVLKTLTVQQTSIGYVNIRDKASTGGNVIGKASTGETYSFIKTQSGWYQIVLKDGTSTGWISAQYVKEN